MVPRNTSVVVQNMFSIAPKPLNAVNVVLNSFIDKLLGVIDHQMLTKTLQRPIVSLLGSSGVGMVDRALRYGAPVRVMGSAPRFIRTSLPAGSQQLQNRGKRLKGCKFLKL